MDRVTARLMNEEAYNLPEEEDLIRDFASLQQEDRPLRQTELEECARKIDARLREVVEARKYELATRLVQLRDRCNQRQADAIGR